MKYSLEEWELLSKSLQGKGSEQVDKATSEFKLAIIDKLRSNHKNGPAFLQRVGEMWDKKIAELKEQMKLAANNKGGQKKAPSASKQNNREDRA